MSPEQMTALDQQVLEIIQQYQEENKGKSIPHNILLEQLEQTLPQDQKFKAAEYLTPVLTNLRGFNQIKSNDDTSGEMMYEVVEDK